MSSRNRPLLSRISPSHSVNHKSEAADLNKNPLRWNAIFFFSVVIAAFFAASFKLIFTFNYGVIKRSSLDLWICSFKSLSCSTCIDTRWKDLQLFHLIRHVFFNLNIPQTHFNLCLWSLKGPAFPESIWVGHFPLPLPQLFIQDVNMKWYRAERRKALEK